MDKKSVVCKTCGYEWETKSKLILITCPSCHYNVKNPYNQYEFNDEPVDNDFVEEEENDG